MTKRKVIQKFIAKFENRDAMINLFGWLKEKYGGQSTIQDVYNDLMAAQSTEGAQPKTWWCCGVKRDITQRCSCGDRCD